MEGKRFLKNILFLCLRCETLAFASVVVLGVMHIFQDWFIYPQSWAAPGSPIFLLRVYPSWVGQQGFNPGWVGCGYEVQLLLLFCLLSVLQYGSRSTGTDIPAFEHLLEMFRLKKMTMFVFLHVAEFINDCIKKIKPVTPEINNTGSSVQESDPFLSGICNLMR